MNQLSHRSSSFVISSSMMFERAAFYGLRALLIIFMISESIGYSTTEAIKVYSIFTGVLVASRIVGAIIGDFLLGSKISMIVGVFLQAIGAFSISMSSPPFLYAGLALILIGGGLYSPNVLALFGKQYLDRKRLSDSGFVLFYVAINIGAGLGIYVLSITSGNAGFSIGFALAGVLFIISGVLAIFSGDAKGIPEEHNSISVTKRTLNVIAAISIAAFFWFLYELSSPKTREIQQSLLGIDQNPFSTEMWQSLNPAATILGGLFLFFIWNRIDLSQYLKYGIGFIFGSLAMVVLYFFTPMPNAVHLLFFGCSMVLLSAAELFIAPVVYSTIARYVNPKYMAMVMSVTFIPSFLFTSIIGLFGEHIYQNTGFALLFSLVFSILAGGTMLGLHYLMKEDSPVVI